VTLHIIRVMPNISVLFAVSPAAIGVWVEAYSGVQLYHEDRGLSLYTSYIYRLTVHNDYGFLTSKNSSVVVTHGGQPFESPVLTVITISHTALQADWTIPGRLAVKLIKVIAASEPEL